MGDSIASSAFVRMGDVLVNSMEETIMNGTDCLTASLWITGLNGTDTFRQL